jgi:asparagine synthase (glutamine-hydrolysing)
MCGISGQLSWTRPPDLDLVARMTCAVTHRGPDGGQTRAIGPVALGHRRLAIIDLSTGGDQPMTDTSGTCWIVFNGEIYNFPALRRELSADGVTFKSQSDTEVILEAYKKWGVGVLQRLNGMFAFALWDDRARTLLIARDRLGKKPLYYRQGPGAAVTFASEIKALAEDPALDRTLNPRALSQYFSLNYTLTSDAIFSGVTKLRPGHYMTWSEAGPSAQLCYWDIAAHLHAPSPYRSVDEAAEALQALLDDAVKIRLISDVPLGVFLSGGVDSSALAASMCQALPPPEVRSFSMGFAQESYNELTEARRTAQALGITHLDRRTDPDVAEILDRIVYHGDEPFADTSMIPMYLLAQFAREHVTVCLSGDGGDEVFAGYETYAADKLQRWMRLVPAPIIGAAAAAARSLLPVSFDKVSFDYKLRQFLGAHSFPPARAHYHWRTIFSEREKQQLLHPAVWREVSAHDPFEEFERFDREAAGADLLGRGMYVDLKTWLADDILVKADRMSMAHGLETRTPFLDYRVVEFAAALPSEWKLKGFQKKHVLKLSQQGRVPDEVLRRRKQGFNAPVSHWLLSSFKAKFMAMLSEPSAPGLQILQPDYVRGLWDEHLAGRRDNGHKLLGLINFQLWCRQHRPRFA